MQLREVSAQVDSGAQDKQLQLNLLGSSDAVFQQRNRELAIVEGELSKQEQELQQAKFDLLQLESTVARLRTDCSGYEVDSKTSVAPARRARRAARGSAAGAGRRGGAGGRGAAAARGRARRAKPRAQRGAGGAAGAGGGHPALPRRPAPPPGPRPRRWPSAPRGCACCSSCTRNGRASAKAPRRSCRGGSTASSPGRRVSPITQGLEVKPEFGKALEALLGSPSRPSPWPDSPWPGGFWRISSSRRSASACLQVCAGRPPATEGRRRSARVSPAGHGGAGRPGPGASGGRAAGGVLHRGEPGCVPRILAGASGFQFPPRATLKGELVDRRGLVYGGHQKKPAGGIVQREIDLRETARELARDQKAARRAAQAASTSWARRWPRPKRRWSSSASTC